MNLKMPITKLFGISAAGFSSGEDDIENYNSMIVLSHFKGHQMAGFGGALKNMSIGIASALGKINIHTAGKGKTFEDSRKIEFFMDEENYKTYKISDYFIDLKDQELNREPITRDNVIKI